MNDLIPLILDSPQKPQSLSKWNIILAKSPLFFPDFFPKQIVVLSQSKSKHTALIDILNDCTLESLIISFFLSACLLPLFPAISVSLCLMNMKYIYRKQEVRCKDWSQNCYPSSQFQAFLAVSTVPGDSQQSDIKVHSKSCFYLLFWLIL